MLIGLLGLLVMVFLEIMKIKGALFIGIIIFINSIYGLITHILLTIVFIMTPWAEEVWLEEEYGEEYLEFKKKVPRFL